MQQVNETNYTFLVIYKIVELCHHTLIVIYSDGSGYNIEDNRGIYKGIPR